MADTDTLRAGRAKPEEYRGLVVRIAGDSACLVELGRDLQDDIIAPNENQL